MAEAKKRKASEYKDSAFDLNSHPFYLFSHIFLYRNRELNRELARYKLDYQRWRVLAVLDEEPGCTMQTLADRTGVDRTTLVHTVRLMIGARLVTKKTRETDRRSVVLALTERGQRILLDILPVVIAINEQCLSGFTRQEVTFFISQLQRIINNINGAVPVPPAGPSEVSCSENVLFRSRTVRRKRA